MSSITKIISIASRWIEKAEVEENAFDKFIFYWISFNCFYVTMTKETTDSKALKKLIVDKNLHTYFDSNFISKYNKELKEIKALGEIKDNRDGSEKFRIISEKFLFEEIILALYQVRNNLFHGSKLDSDERDKEVIDRSLPIIKLIAVNSLEILIKN